MNDKPMITVTVSRMTDAVAVGAKGTLKRNLVGTTDGDYPQTLDFEFFGKNVDLLNDVRPGDVVEIKYDLRGREWTNPNTGKTSVFVTLSACGLHNLMAEGSKAEPTSSQVVMPPQPPAADAVDDVEENLPF